MWEISQNFETNKCFVMNNVYIMYKNDEEPRSYTNSED
jgi:hypothetical protein